MPKVSVIIPTYNYGHMLAESIDSVLTQDYDDFELIIVDDGSTDNTAAVVLEYGDRLRYVKQDHAGIAIARNTGVACARGKLIAFQDADDLWVTDTLAMRVSAMERHPELGMVFGDVSVERDGKTLFSSFLSERKALVELKTVSDGELRIIADSAFSALLKERFIPVPTIIIPKRRFDEVGLWDSEMDGVEDYEFYLRLSREFPLGYINKVLARCRIHGANISCDVIRQNERRIGMLRQFENDSSLSNADRLGLRRRLSELYIESAWYFKNAGFPERARADYLCAWSFDKCNCGALLRCAATLGRHSRGSVL